MRNKILLGGVLFLAVLLCLLSVVSLVSAEIMISQPKALYNINDGVDISVTIETEADSVGFLELSLMCRNESKNFYYEQLSLNSGEGKMIEKILVLDKPFLGNTTGRCNIKADYLYEQILSQSFEISNKINVGVEVDEARIEPGENFIISGIAIKRNGENVDGFVEASIVDESIEIKDIVEDGNFKINFSFPYTTQAKSYTLFIRVYDKKNNIIGNEGDIKTTVRVIQVATKIEIALEKQSVEPGTEFPIKPFIRDQIDEEMGGDVTLILSNTKGEIIFQNITKSAQTFLYEIENNATPGYWKIEASAFELEAKKLFYVEEMEKASFEIINDTLIVKNIGNVPYKRNIQVAIGNEIEMKNIAIEIGGEKKFLLSAPDGKYDVRITDGSESFDIGEVALTGGVVGIKEVGGKRGLLTRYNIVWIFLVVVIGLFLLVMIQRVVRKKISIYTQKVKDAEHLNIDKKDKDIKIATKATTKEAEHTLVLHGHKMDAALIFLEIKNKVKKGIMSNTLDKIIKIINENKGVVYNKENYLIGIFSPATTKTFKNNISAVKIAKEIISLIEEHNKKFKDKIDFGVGIHSGKLIIKKDGDKVKFTSLGNVLSLGKKIANISKGEILLSDNIRKKVMGEIKTEKKTKKGIDVYTITRIIERNKGQEFIKDFLKRVEGGEGKK